METFVVRVFVPAGREQLELSGLVERAGTGRAESFSTPQGLVDAVLRELGVTPRVFDALETKEAE